MTDQCATDALVDSISVFANALDVSRYRVVDFENTVITFLVPKVTVKVKFYSTKINYLNY